MEIKLHSQKQEDAVFSNADITVLGTGIQFGKAIDLDTLVLTTKGFKPAREITLDDKLFDRDGKPTRVLGVYPQGKRQCFEISFKTGEIIIVDEDHLNFVIDPHGRKERVLATKDLHSMTHYYKRPNTAQFPNSRPIRFRKKQYLISPYVMGALLGDGGISKGSIVFTSKDKPVLRRVIKELPDGMILKHIDRFDYRIIHKDPERCSKGYGHNLMSTALKILGLKGTKSNNKFIPDVYKYGNIEDRHALLQGLMDTDGTISYPSCRKIEFYSVSAQLTKDVKYLVESLGGKAWIAEKKTHYTKNGEKIQGQLCYRVNIILKDYNPFHLYRKARKHFKHKHTTNKVLKDVKKIGLRETVCFSVESETKSFVIEHMIVTHNTLSGSLWIGKYFPQYPTDNFIITAPTYKIMSQATLPAFLSCWGNMGKFHKVDAFFQLHSGGKVFLRTNTEPDSIVGITDVRAIWGDEAGKYSLYFWENMQARAARLDAPTCLTTSPYTVNWIYKDLIRPTQKGIRNDVKLISAKSIENPYFSKKTYYAQKKTMDPRRFKALYDGEFTQMQGLVYDCFDQRYNMTDQVTFPNGTKFYGGIDWGFTHPFVITVRAILPSGLQIQVSEFYKTGMSIEQMKKEIGSRVRLYGVKQFFCDPSRPDLIGEMCQAGLPCVKADNDILLGIDLTYELLKTKRLLFSEHASKYTIDELETYHWPEPKDLKPDQDDKELRPVDASNHVMDAMRYVTMGTRHLSNLRPPGMPEENEQKQLYPDQIISRVKRAPKAPKHENWS